MAQRVQPFTSNYNLPKAANDPFTVQLLWTHSGRHYSPAYQRRGLTQRGPCRNKEAGEEASASPRPCRDEPPTGDTESSATLLMSSRAPKTAAPSWSPRSTLVGNLFSALFRVSTLQQQHEASDVPVFVIADGENKMEMCEIDVSHNCDDEALKSPLYVICHMSCFKQHHKGMNWNAGDFEMDVFYNRKFLLMKSMKWFCQLLLQRDLKHKKGLNFIKKTPLSTLNY